MKILCVGEAMAEIRGETGGFAIGFAGDTFNTAVYCRRSLGPMHDVAYLTRVGQDPLSGGFLSLADSENIGMADVSRDPALNIGIYSVQTDTKGERSFAYWRSQSAARALFQSDSDLAALGKADLIYLSAITLAIIEPAARDRLLDRLSELRTGGTRIAFDSNYRPRLWTDPATARACIARAWQITDVALPSLDDELALFGDSDEAGVLARLRSWGCREGVLKRGADGPVPLDLSLPQDLALRQADHVVDTTAAGDSFNGGYLAARAEGKDEVASIVAGHDLARYVVGLPGAIVSMSGFHGIA